MSFRARQQAAGALSLAPSTVIAGYSEGSDNGRSLDGRAGFSQFLASDCPGQVSVAVLADLDGRCDYVVAEPMAAVPQRFPRPRSTRVERLPTGRHAAGTLRSAQAGGMLRSVSAPTRLHGVGSGLTPLRYPLRYIPERGQFPRW